MTQTHSHDHDHAGHDHAGHDHASHAAPVVAAPEVDSDRAARSAAALDQVATPPTAEELAAKAAETLLIDDIEEALRDVVDPELGVNIVDLGLVYDLQMDKGSNKLTIDMTLTSAACPLTDMIEDQISGALMGGESGLVEDFTINWVWLPPWGPEKITDDGREQLRALGFNI